MFRGPSTVISWFNNIARDADESRGTGDLTHVLRVFAKALHLSFRQLRFGQPLARAAAAIQLCLLSLLLWLSWDAQAHHRLHHLVDSICKMCGGHTSGHIDSHGHGDEDHHFPGSEDRDCAITLLGRGALDTPVPPVTIQPRADTPLVRSAPEHDFFLPPVSSYLLPFACGPPQV